MRKILLAVVFSLAMAVPMSAQGSVTLKKIDQEFVHHQFGDQFTFCRKWVLPSAIWMAMAWKTS